MKAIIGVDGSKYAEWALGWLGEMPFRAAPRVMAIHAMDPQSVRAPFFVQPSISGYEPDEGEAIHLLESRAKQVAAETKRRLSELGLKGSVHVVQDKIAEVLIERAGSNGLIVVGSRGLDAIDRFVLGSVSTAVTLYASCPVLIVKEPPHPLRRILLATDGSPSAKKALQFVTKQLTTKSEAKPLLILLDLNLPDMHGYDVLKQLRVARVNTPILILSGTADIDTKVRGLGFGADDYMTKPFHKDELVARIHAIVRRSKQSFLRDWLALGFEPGSAYGVTYRSLGTETVNNATYNVVEATAPDDFTAKLYFDASTNRLAMMRYRAPGGMQSVRMGGPPPAGAAPGGNPPPQGEGQQQRIMQRPAGPMPDVDYEIVYSDYKAVDGVQLPHRFRRSSNGELADETEIKRYKLNSNPKADKFKTTD